MSDSENQGATWGQWYPRIRDDGFIRARYSETHLGNSEYQHLDAYYLNALEATITTLKAQLEAAEEGLKTIGKHAPSYTDSRGSTVFSTAAAMSTIARRTLRTMRALSAPASDTEPASDTGSEECDHLGFITSDGYCLNCGKESSR